jgi:hypothetical protein
MLGRSVVQDFEFCIIDSIVRREAGGGVSGRSAGSGGIKRVIKVRRGGTLMN